MRIHFLPVLRFAFITLAFGSFAWQPHARAHDDDAAPYTGKEKLGHVEFRISCNAGAQAEFNRGMALFHSFWFDPAIKSFKSVLAQDPSCGMAHWRIAFIAGARAGRRAKVFRAVVIGRGQCRYATRGTCRSHDASSKMTFM